jgi:hypothetical protein
MATVRGQAAAVEVDSKLSDDCVTLHIQRLHAANNAGAAVRISGQVRYSLQDCNVDGNSVNSSSDSDSSVQMLAHGDLQPIEIDACSGAAGSSDKQAATANTAVRCQ